MMLILTYCDLYKEELYTFFRELYMHFIVNRVELPWQAQPNICYWLDTSTYKPLVTSYHLSQLDASGIRSLVVPSLQ